MAKAWKIIRQILTSTRLALWLILVLSGLILYGVTRSRTSFGSPWLMLPVAVLLLINTLFCTVVQLCRAGRNYQHQKTFQALTMTKPPNLLTLPLGEQQEQAKVLQKIARLSQRRGYHILLPDSEGQPVVDNGSGLSANMLQIDKPLLVGRKGRLGYWGSPLFHIGLIIVLLGGLLTSLFRVNGGIILGEDSTGNLAANLTPEGNTTFALRHVNLDFNSSGKLQDLIANIDIKGDGRTKEGTLTASSKLYDGLLSVGVYDSGYTAGLVFGQGGRQLARLLVGMENKDDGHGGYIREAQVTVPGTEKQLKLDFWPNLVWQGGLPATYGDAPKNPGVSVQVISPGKESQTTSQVVTLGRTVNVGNVSVTFDHYLPWVEFEIVRDPGYPVIQIGLLLSIAGLALMFLLTPKELVIRMVKQDEGNMVSVGGRCYRFRGAFARELSDISEEIVAHCAL